jgi:hypothetical protein
MSVSDRPPTDFSATGLGSGPTDRSLPLRRRTRPGPYLIALVLALMIGLMLIALGTFRLGQSTTSLERAPNAFAPTENLMPAEGNANGSSSFRDDAATPPTNGAPGEQTPASSPP